MQLKLIETTPEGAKKVLCSPKFAVEVAKSDADDEGAEQTTTFTALEDAVAKAKGTYDERLLRIEVDETCIFKAFYADGTVYETDAIKECLMVGPTLLSKSYAVGDTGAREDEATDNSKYYSNVSRSSSKEAKKDGDYATDLLTEVRKHGVYTSFGMDFETGELLYASPSYNFSVDPESGELIADGKDYSFEETVKGMVAEDLADGVAEKAMEILESSVEGLSTETPYASDLSADFEKPKLVHWNSNTAFTPYASGLTTANEGFAIVHGKFSENHSIIAWGNGDRNDIFMHTVSNGVAIGWNNYITNTGGILSGSLGVGDGKGNVSANDEYTVLSADKDADNSRQISVANPTTEAIPLADAVKFSETIDGVKTDYKLFGEHNIDSMLGLLNSGQIEIGTFKGIGLAAVQAGNIPSIEFKNINPAVVFILENEGFHVFARTLSLGFGRQRFANITFIPTWEHKKLIYRINAYSFSAGSWSYPSSAPDSSNINYFLADGGVTYTYIAIGNV